MPEDNHVTRALPQSPQKTLKASPPQSGDPECVYVNHAAHWVDVLRLAGCGHSRHGRPTPDTEGPLLPNDQFEIPAYEVSRTSQPEVEQTLEKAIQQGQPTLLQRTTDNQSSAKIEPKQPEDGITLREAPMNFHTHQIDREVEDQPLMECHVLRREVKEAHCPVATDLTKLAIVTTLVVLLID